MILPVFTESKSCKGGRHCRECRDEGMIGDGFRAAMANSFTIPAGKFPCPYGKPFGFIPPKPSASIPSHPNAPKPPPRNRLSPGNVVATVLHKMGYAQTPDCGCAQFAAQMDKWGWRGCFSHRADIVAWFKAKADQSGIAIDGPGVWALVRGGIKDQMRRRKK